MATQRPALHAFNRGIVSPRALGRVDLERMRLSAEEQNNWMPRSLGPMSLRPGLQYKLSTRSDASAIIIPFIYSTTQTALIEVTGSYIRPLISESVITRASVSTAVTNGDFSSGTGWTITTSGGSTGAVSGGKLTMTCLPIDSSVVTSRTVTVAGGDQNVEHAFRIVVDQGPVVFRAGSTSGGDEYVTQTTLGTGTHSLTFTPSGANVYIELESRVQWPTIVDSITIEGSGTMTLPGPWAEADLSLIRWAQSGDIVFCTCYGYKAHKIERRATRSWSIVEYEPIDGPFAAVSGDSEIKMSISAARSAGTLTASRPYFRSTHVGSLFRLFTPGYNLSFDLGKADVFTPAVRINGVGSGRTVSIVTTGTWVGTLTVQKSFLGEDTGFADTATTITTNTTTSVTDTSDNTAVWVRVGFKTGNYTSGTATAQLTFGAGGGGGFGGGTVTSTGGRTGVARITSVTNSTTAVVDILSHFSSSIASLDWFEGEWSDRQGYPSAVAFHEGRLFFAGRDKIWGSISDAFSSFSPAQEGDSGPIQRSIGYGPVQIINWLLPLSRMLLGTEASEVAVRSSSFDEPLTPVNFSLKDVSTLGSKRIAAAKIDTRGLYVERSGQRLMELAYSVETNDYQSTDATLLAPDLNVGNPITRLAVQRQPDTRIHCVRTDGTVAIYVTDPIEQVKCWVTFETDGVVEDVAILPGTYEDSVYYIVRRTINGGTKRYIEKWAQENECVGGTLNKQADSFILYSGASATTITGLSHLEGEAVIVWGDGVDLSPDNEETGVQTTYTVASGQITLSTAVTSAVIGLPYKARIKSAKLAYAAQGGTALLQKKRVGQLGVLLYQTHWRGLRHGPDYDHLQPLPKIENGTTVAANTIHDQYDQDMFVHGTQWDTDSRLCLEAKAPRPCTVLGVVLEIKTNG